MGRQILLQITQFWNSNLGCCFRSCQRTTRIIFCRCSSSFPRKKTRNENGSTASAASSVCCRLPSRFSQPRLAGASQVASFTHNQNGILLFFD
jgi:hypothetical protein